MSKMDEVLQAVPEEHRLVVRQLVTRRLNCTGGRPSDAARAEVAQYEARGYEAMVADLEKKWW